jgi:hypothetical protein
VRWVPDLPDGCPFAITQRDWIGNCVSAGIASDCVGVGPRTISDIGDVYLYRTFRCPVTTSTWTSARLKVAQQEIATSCKTANFVVYCRSSAFGHAAVTRQGVVRVQVTGRFTALVTWHGHSWKRRIQPRG